MDQITEFQLLATGQGKIEEARKLLCSGWREKDSPCNKKKLLSLRKWFFEHASQVKEVLQSGKQVNNAKRQHLEKLVNSYTVIICEIDAKISKFPLF